MKSLELIRRIPYENGESEIIWKEEEEEWGEAEL